MRYTNNFLTIGPRYIMAVGNHSQDLRDAVHGVNVEWMSIEALIKGYGTAYYMA